ncbi:MAG: FIST signal transduction protein [Nannocystales bacterium]
MRTLEGSSLLVDGAGAVKEATGGWSETPEMIFVFYSSQHDADAVAKALAEQYPDVPTVGCSTAGEHLGAQHSRDSLVVAGLCDTGVDWVVESVEGLEDFDDARGEALAERLFERHGTDADNIDPDEYVALLFVDGLCRVEERVSAAVAAGLAGVALAGGSAGDDLAFKRTTVIHNGTAAADRATVVLAKSRGTKFRVVKHQHFTTEAAMLAVTRADPDDRRVYELDGYPAAEAYARALGLETEKLDGTALFSHPVMFCCDGEKYVRSVQAVNDDGSLTFFCAIEEGMVLQLGSHHEMKEALESDLHSLAEPDPVDFLLGFNCVLRALEATQRETWEELGAVVGSVSRSSIGFDTYGEQLNGLHINQTLVAVAFSSDRSAA